MAYPHHNSPHSLLIVSLRQRERYAMLIRLSNANPNPGDCPTNPPTPTMGFLSRLYHVIYMRNGDDPDLK